MLHIILLLLLVLVFAALVTATDFEQDEDFVYWLYDPIETDVSVLFEGNRVYLSHTPPSPCESTESGKGLLKDSAHDVPLQLETSEQKAQDAPTGSTTFVADHTALAGAHFAGQPRPPHHDNNARRELSALGLENLHNSPVKTPGRQLLPSGWQDDPASIPSSSRYGLLSPPPTQSSHSAFQPRAHAGTQQNRLMHPATPSVTSLNDSKAFDLMSALSCPASSSSASPQPHEPCPDLAGNPAIAFGGIRVPVAVLFCIVARKISASRCSTPKASLFTIGDATFPTQSVLISARSLDVRKALFLHMSVTGTWERMALLGFRRYVAPGWIVDATS
ncbi:hypothetical protein TI39_contig4230g00011 [Zymoseptoria brevis]|uniref:Uncharacterized protein n=1 Tax=Zymoseptoria brevis TaxID=1047168 RepID=A0A0F4G9G3_9PEZI|nr:hypothetical protein TI39_contig4230g00011 [Zymoseptoria brevis]